MRIVLDTNVLISGIYFSGLPGKILQAWRSQKLQLAVSTEILEEYLNVAERLATQYVNVEYEEILGRIYSARLRKHHPVGRVSCASARNHNNAHFTVRGVTRRYAVGLRCAIVLVQLRVMGAMRI